MHVFPLQLSDSDQELYKNFNLTVSDRWQQEIAETVFEVVNLDADKVEFKRRQKPREEAEDCKHCYCFKLLSLQT